MSVFPYPAGVLIGNGAISFRVSSKEPMTIEVLLRTVKNLKNILIVDKDGVIYIYAGKYPKTGVNWFRVVLLPPDYENTVRKLVVGDEIRLVSDLIVRIVKSNDFPF